MKRINSILIVSLFCSSGAFAACDQTSIPKAPSVPSGDTATFDQMVAAGQDVQAYIDQTEGQIVCIHSSLKYNYTVKQIRNVAENYNRELRVFKSRES